MTLRAGLGCAELLEWTRGDLLAGIYVAARYATEKTRNLRRHFAKTKMNDLKSRDISGYIALRQTEGVSDSTINRELSLFSAAINHANREWEWGLPNPVKGRKLREPEGRDRYLAKGEA